jgi:hypothetical protein
VAGLVPDAAGAPPAPRHVFLDPELVVRESTGIAAASAGIQQPGSGH